MYISCNGKLDKNRPAISLIRCCPFCLGFAHSRLQYKLAFVPQLAFVPCRIERPIISVVNNRSTGTMMTSSNESSKGQTMEELLTSSVPFVGIESAKDDTPIDLFQFTNKFDVHRLVLFLTGIFIRLTKMDA